MRENLSKNENLNLKDGSGSVITDTEEDPSIRPLLSTREKLCKVFHSHRFQVVVIALVLIDCLIVIAELILEAKHHELDKIIPTVLRSMSVAILGVFIIEILLKLYAFGTEFFHHKLEIFDAIVIFLSFGLDIAYWDHDGVDLIIILRLWRVARIINGVLVSVKTQSEHKLLKERQLREAMEQELTKCRLYANTLEQEVETLRSVLKKHGIEEIPASVVQRPQNNMISVVAEVNQVSPV